MNFMNNQNFAISFTLVHAKLVTEVLHNCFKAYLIIHKNSTNNNFLPFFMIV